MAQPARSRFAWTDGGAQTFDTDLHTQQHRLRKNRPVFPVESLDGTVVEAISIGSGQNETAVTIMSERDRTGLRDFLDAADRRLVLTYTPDQDNASGTTFTVTAVGPVPRMPDMESEGNQSPRYTVGPIVLRRLDGGAFDP